MVRKKCFPKRFDGKVTKTNKREPKTIPLNNRLSFGKKSLRPGEKVVCDYRLFQTKLNLCLNKKVFQSLVKQIIQKELLKPIRVQVSALWALQVCCENYLKELFELANFCAIHAKRKTVRREDMDLVKRLKFKY